MSRKDPRTREEWQLAVDAACALRLIADCKMYGLIAGGPTIDVGRCDDILDRGKAHGIHPSKPQADLAIAIIAAINEEAAEKVET